MYRLYTTHALWGWANFLFPQKEYQCPFGGPALKDAHNDKWFLPLYFCRYYKNKHCTNASFPEISFEGHERANSGILQRLIRKPRRNYRWLPDQPDQSQVPPLQRQF